MDKYTKYNDDGSINVTLSAQAYTDALNAWKLENEIPADRIESAVDAILAQKDGRVATPTLCHLAAISLGADVNTLKPISDRIHAYIKAQRAAGKLFMVKGVNGGVSRTAPAKKAE
jgi:hypothetical protein